MNFLKLKEWTNRVFIINFLNDSLIFTKEGILYGINEFFHSFLMDELGYENIAFVEQKGLFFLDEKSEENLMFPMDYKKENKNVNSNKKNILLPRPYNISIKKTEACSNENSIKNSLENNKTSKKDQIHKYIYSFEDNYEELLRKVISIINDESKKNCVIIHDLRGLLNLCSLKIINVFNNFLANDIKNLNKNSKNKNVIIIIEKISPKILYDQYRHFNLFSLLKDSNDQNPCFSFPYIELGSITRDDIKAILKRLAFVDKKEIDFSIIKEIELAIFKKINDDKLRLEEIYHKLNELEKINEKTLKSINIEIDKKDPMEELNQLVGLKELKVQIESYVKGCKPIKSNYEKISKNHTDRFGVLRNSELPEINHLFFLGNPGTGKTTVAMLLGKILQRKGILEIGHTVKVTRSDLVGEYVGETAIKTKRKIDEALGGILFVDEAYSLYSDSGGDFGKEAIDTIVEAMSDKKGQFLVIMAGYRNEMDKLLNMNTGLKRRVKEIIFEDYNAEELAQILISKLSKYSFSKEIAERAVNYCNQILMNRDKNGGEHFGNAGVIEKIVDSVVRNARIRTKSLYFSDSYINLDQKLDIQIEDFENKEWFYKEIFEDEDSIENLIGLEDVKKELKRMFKTFVISKRENKKIELGHFAFYGNPGTGKTSVANIIAKEFYKIGLLRSAKVISRTAKDLIGRYVGETENKVKEIFLSARGGVLLIDEAHQLISNDDGSRNDFGSNALHTLIPLMENYRNEVVVIFAGYEDDLERLFRYDPGLSSRISRKIRFPDYSSPELVQIFFYMLNKNYNDLIIIDRKIIEEELIDIFSKLSVDMKRFGNARGVRNFITKLYENVCERVYDNNLEKKEIFLEDIKKTFEEIYEYYIFGNL